MLVLACCRLRCKLEGEDDMTIVVLHREANVSFHLVRQGSVSIVFASPLFCDTREKTVHGHVTVPCAPSLRVHAGQRPRWRAHVGIAMNTPALHHVAGFAL